MQSIAMRLICDREEEIKDFKPDVECRGQATFKIDGQEIKADLKNKFKDLKEGRKFLEVCRATKFTIESIEIKPSYKNPAAPFKTSTLQQEAAQKFGFSIKQTMIAAQSFTRAALLLI